MYQIQVCPPFVPSQLHDTNLSLRTFMHNYIHYCTNMYIMCAIYCAELSITLHPIENQEQTYPPGRNIGGRC